MIKMYKNLLLFISMLIFLAAVFGVGYFVGINSLKGEAEIVTTEPIDLMLPTEVEKRIVTKEEIETKLVEISELNTYSGEYTVEKSVEQTRYLLEELAILGTTNKIDIECTGIVKVGYDIDEIVIKVDEISGTIYITLPPSKVMDNYIIWDSVKVNEQNNIFNPINFEQYEVLISELEQDGLAEVEKGNIYELADENIKLIIKNFLSEFQDYTVEFMN